MSRPRPAIGPATGLASGLVVALLLLVALTACGRGGAQPDTHTTATPASPGSGGSSASGGSGAPASAPPRPAAHGCDDLTYQQALAPTLPDGDTGVPCSGPHTSQTYAVGTLATVVDGHLAAVDSAQAQSQVARTCPRRLSAYLGGDAEKLRLSMLRPVWFTPTVSQAAAGADWFRCDVIALAGDQQLAALTGSLKGVLDSPKSQAWALCATAQPGTAGFARVPCQAQHSWRALSTIDLPGGAYPGQAKVKAAGQKPCQQAGQAVASDALDYQWGYEWPTAAQWKSGQTYGICWAPDKG